MKNLVCNMNKFFQATEKTVATSSCAKSLKNKLDAIKVASIFMLKSLHIIIILCLGILDIIIRSKSKLKTQA